MTSSWLTKVVGTKFDRRVGGRLWLVNIFTDQLGQAEWWVTDLGSVYELGHDEVDPKIDGESIVIEDLRVEVTSVGESDLIVGSQLARDEMSSMINLDLIVADQGGLDQV